MRRLVRWTAFAAVLGAAIWWARGRLLPSPIVDSEPAPPFRAAPSGSSSAAIGDIQAVKGIGPVYAGRLAGIEIRSLSDLAGTEATDLADRLEIQVAQAEDWIDQARGLLR